MVLPISASRRLPMRCPRVVIDQLEVVEIEEDDAELVAEAGGAVDLGFDAVVEMARVVEAGAVVGDGEFLDLFDGAGVVDGDGGVVGHGLQEHELIFAEASGFDVDELDDAEDAVLGGERDAEDGAGLPAGHLVDAGGEALVLGDVGNQQGFAVLGDPSGDAFADAEADGLEGGAGVADGDGEVEFVMLIVGHEQAPGVWPEVGGDLLHDGLQDGVEIERRGERLGHVVQDGQLRFGVD